MIKTVSKNLDWVTPQIAIGGRITWFKARKLRKAGITHVLNVRVTSDPEIHGIENYHNPTVDDKLPKGACYWFDSAHWAVGILSNRDNKLYVHCKMGKNRSSGTVYAILKAFGYEAKEAWSLIKQARPKVTPRYVRDVDKYL